MSRIAVIMLIAMPILAGCSAGEKDVAVAHGTWRPLAAGLWDIDPARVTVPPMPGE